MKWVRFEWKSKEVWGRKRKKKKSRKKKKRIEKEIIKQG